MVHFAQSIGCHFMCKIHSFQAMNVDNRNTGHSLSTLTEDSGSVKEGLRTCQRFSVSCMYEYLYSTRVLNEIVVARSLDDLLGEQIPQPPNRIRLSRDGGGGNVAFRDIASAVHQHLVPLRQLFLFTRGT